MTNQMTKKMTKKHKFYFLFIGIFVSISLLFNGCKNKTSSMEVKSASEFEVLLNVLENNGDYVNSDKFPSNIDASLVYQNIDKNFLIIDIRDEDAYNNGHIKGAFNIKPDSLMSFFENVIEPNSFDSIVMVCDIGVRSAFVTSILRLLGYNNVFSMKFGMCAWHSNYADALWLKSVSSKPENELEVADNPLPQKLSYPQINTGESVPYKILRARADTILADTIKKYFVSIDDVSKNYLKYFIVKYGFENNSNLGQLKGAYQFLPKKSLNSKTDLFKLPTDKPILVYCYTGTKSSFVVAYLRILGYDAYSLKYGANGFMYNVMLKNFPDNVFTKQNVYNFPLEFSQSVPTLNQQSNPVALKVKGGC